MEPLEIAPFLDGDMKVILNVSPRGIVQVGLLEKFNGTLFTMNVRDDDVVRMHEWLDRIIEIKRREGSIRPEREEKWRESVEF